MDFKPAKKSSMAGNAAIFYTPFYDSFLKLWMGGMLRVGAQRTNLPGISVKVSV